MKTTYLKNGDVALETDLHGNPGDPLVILMHGGGQTRHAWRSAAQNLAERGYYAIAYDARGHGGSSWSSKGDYGIEVSYEDAVAVVEQIGAPAAFVGASGGGASGLLISARRPEWVSALVLVDFAPRINQEGAKHILNFMQSHREGFSSVDEAAEAVAKFLPHRKKPRDVSGLRKNLREREDGRLYWHWDPALLDGPRNRADLEALMVAEARRVTAPTLVVRGGISDVVTIENAAYLKSLIPHAQCVDIAGASHMVAGDRNDNFNAAVIGFLEQVVPARAKR